MVSHCRMTIDPQGRGSDIAIRAITTVESKYLPTACR